MVITLTARERNFMFEVINKQYQSDYYRSLNLPVIQALLSKLQSLTPDFNEEENRWLQWTLFDILEVWTRLGDQRAQHIIQGGYNGRQGGVGSAQVPPGGPNASGGGQSAYFNGGATAQLANSVMNKLKGK